MPVSSKDAKINSGVIKTYFSFVKVAFVLALTGFLIKDLINYNSIVRNNDRPLLSNLLRLFGRTQNVQTDTSQIFAPLQSNPEDSNPFNKPRTFVLCTIYVVLALILLH